MEVTEDVTDIILENKALFEQLRDLKNHQKDLVRERDAVCQILSDQFSDLCDKPYYDIIHHLLNVYFEKGDQCNKALSRAIEKEGEVITGKATLNSVQQHNKLEIARLQNELQHFKDQARNENDRHKMSVNEQINMLIQERDTARANEETLTLRLGEMMNEVDRLNEEVTLLKQEKIDLALKADVKNDEAMGLKQQLCHVEVEHQNALSNLQADYEKRQLRCQELEEELLIHERRNDQQRSDMKVSDDNASQMQVDVFRLKAKCKDYSDQINVLNRQMVTLQDTNKTLTEDNQILAEKYVDLTNKFHEKETELTSDSRNYKYKIEELHREIEGEREQRETLHSQYEQKTQFIEGMQLQLNGLRMELNKTTRLKCDLEIQKRNADSLVEQLKLDKEQLLKDIAGEELIVQQFLRQQELRNEHHETEFIDVIKKLKEDLRISEEKNDKQEGDKDLLRLKIKELESDLERVNVKLEDTQSDVSKVNHETLEKEKLIEKLEGEIRELQNDIMDMSLTIETNEEQIASIARSLSLIDIFHENEMKQLCSNLCAVDKADKLKEMIADNNEILKEYHRTMNSFKSQLRESNDENRHLRDTLKQLEVKKVEYEDTISSLNAHLDISHKKVRGDQETLLKLEKRFRMQEKRVTGAENVIKELQRFNKMNQMIKLNDGEKSEFRACLDTVKKCVDQLRNPEISDEVMDREVIIEELTGMKSEFLDMQSAHSLLVKERDNISRKLEHEQNWVDKLRRKEEELTRTLDEKNEQLSSVKHELQLKERAISDKERAFQKKKGELEQEVKTLKKRYNSAISGEQCGHKDMLIEFKASKDQLEIARSTIQYKEEELSKIKKERKKLENNLKSSNISLLQDEIMKLNITNGKLQAQVSSLSGDTDETNYTDERNKLLGVISKTKDEAEDSRRRLYQAELKISTLQQNIDEMKSQRDMERKKHKNDLIEFHQRVAAQKQKLSSQEAEHQSSKLEFTEVRKAKENFEEEVIRLKERITQIRDSALLEGEKFTRLERELDKKSEQVTSLSTHLQSAEEKIKELDSALDGLRSANLDLQQVKTTLELRLADVNQKYQYDKAKFESTRSKLKDKLKNLKNDSGIEISSLKKRLSDIEDETEFLRLEVQRESTWRESHEKAYRTATIKNRELETTCNALENEIQILHTTLHSVRGDLEIRREEVRAIQAELDAANEIRSQYEFLYTDLHRKSLERISASAQAPSSLDVTTLQFTSQNFGAASTPKRNLELSLDPVQGNISKMTLEEEGLDIGPPTDEEYGEGILEEPITIPTQPPQFSEPTIVNEGEGAGGSPSQTVEPDLPGISNSPKEALSPPAQPIVSSPSPVPHSPLETSPQAPHDTGKESPQN